MPVFKIHSIRLLWLAYSLFFSPVSFVSQLFLPSVFFHDDPKHRRRRAWPGHSLKEQLNIFSVYGIQTMENKIIRIAILTVQLEVWEKKNSTVSFVFVCQGSSVNLWFLHVIDKPTHMYTHSWSKFYIYFIFYLLLCLNFLFSNWFVLW